MNAMFKPNPLNQHELEEAAAVLQLSADGMIADGKSTHDKAVFEAGLSVGVIASALRFALGYKTPISETVELLREKMIAAGVTITREDRERILAGK